MIGEGPFPQLSVRRSYAAPAALVFRAFTEPEWLERWFRPSVEVNVKVTELDLRIGGRYRFVFRFPGDHISVVIGEYRTIARPHRLAFTWTWEAPDPHAGIDTLVTIDFNERRGGTELSLTHTGFPTEEIMRQHESGWSAVLDFLPRLADLQSAAVQTRK
jgi:uncharacterized protein YndB with AHSA1/START domain